MTTATGSLWFLTNPTVSVVADVRCPPLLVRHDVPPFNEAGTRPSL
ncbi:hypothetical protein [Rhodococcus opacus]|uniref:Uncharacterized protein n=1 Tax=Rhodococcus opacus TaxID=37919 RepID=A0AAX3YSZ9_RHOOP|nr:hypothetical protein [Rhodococcus opacus]MCZ4586075.1 hypothetical protein [Rhodococcus opacus]MDV6245394.1 hypothetical protein [Rhodococcus opacus]WLF51985.1 hypothetical protein Q5707_41720 [Rhodococcus opacus]